MIAHALKTYCNAVCGQQAKYVVWLVALFTLGLSLATPVHAQVAVLQGTQTISTTLSTGCVSKATINATFYSPLATWPEIVEAQNGTGSFQGTVSYNVPSCFCPVVALACGTGLSANNVAGAVGDWSYLDFTGVTGLQNPCPGNPTQCFTVEWLFASASLSEAFMPGGGYPPIFTLSVTRVSASSVNAICEDESIDTYLSLTTNISTSGPLSINSAQLQPVTVGQAYVPFQFNATGGSPPYVSWTGTGLPDGMQVTPGGVLQGTPDAADAPGPYTLAITVTDSAGTSITQNFSLTLNAASALLFVTSPNLPNATVNSPYSVTLVVSGAINSVSFQLTPDSQLPPGLNLDSSTGVISGTPSEQDTFGFTVVATEAGTGLSTSRTFNLNVGTGGPLTIVGPVDFGIINPAKSPFPVQYQAQGGTRPYQWTVPDPFFGLSFNDCTSDPICTLSGTPVGAKEPNKNDFFQPLIVRDSATPPATAKIVLVGTIQIPNPPPPMTSNGPINSTAVVGLKYLFTDFVDGITGGRGIFSCVPVNPGTQAGLTLSEYGGNCDVFGYPTTTGTFSFTVEITDATGQGPVPVTVYVMVYPCSVPGNPGTPSNNCGPPTIVPDVDRTQGNGLSNVLARVVRAKHTSPAATSVPSINTGGIVDAAAYQHLLTPGGIMSIFGANMADRVYPATSQPLPTSLGNVQVTVNGENAALFYVSPTQINFQAPESPLVYYPLSTACLQAPVNASTFEPNNCPAPGPATVIVIKSNAAIGAVSVPVSTSSPAVLTFPDLAVIATHLDYKLITQSSPAKAGEVIVIYGAGIGYPTCVVLTGYPSPDDCLVNTAPQFTFPDYPSLNNEAGLLYAGLTPGSVGLAQYDFQLPKSLPSAALAAGSIRVRISDPTAGQTFSVYLPSTGPPPPSISYTNQRVSTQAPPATGCVVPSAATSFLTTQNTVYLFFEATTTATDALSVQWIAPGGTLAESAKWTPSAGNSCYSDPLAITNLPATQLGSWKAQVYNKGTLLFSVPFTVKAPASSISYTNQTVSAQPPVGCTAPPAGSSFLTTQNSVYLFFQATTTASDTLSYKWVAPGGSIAQSGSFTPQTGSDCYSDLFTISNLSGSQLGSWSVQVFDNGTLLFTIPFTVSAPATTISYTNQEVSTQGPPASGCVVPPAETSFTTTETTVYLFFQATTTPSDALMVQWMAPGGVVAQSGSWKSETGRGCYSASFTISNLPASQLGSWSVQVYDNGTLLFSVPFTVSAPSILSATGLHVTNGRDNNYEIASDTTGEILAPAAAFVVTSPAGGWGTIPGASWIAPAADQSNATRNGCCTNTSDEYQLIFTVTSNPSTAALNVTVAADDYVDVLLNGVSVFTHPNTAMWGTPVTFSITSGFVLGTNTLDFIVTNGGGPTGLIATITSPVAAQARFVPGQLHLLEPGH